LDGASYHSSKKTFSKFAYLDIKVVISAPYSYNAAAVEMFFALLKNDDINPN